MRARTLPARVVQNVFFYYFIYIYSYFICMVMLLYIHCCVFWHARAQDALTHLRRAPSMRSHTQLSLANVYFYVIYMQYYVILHAYFLFCCSAHRPRTSHAHGRPHPALVDTLPTLSLREKICYHVSNFNSFTCSKYMIQIGYYILSNYIILSNSIYVYVYIYSFQECITVLIRV